MAGHKPTKLTVEEARKKGIIFKKPIIREGNTIYYGDTKEKKNDTRFLRFLTIFKNLGNKNND